MAPGRLILVLGDQLSPSLSALAAGNQQRDIVLMAEVREEAGYVNHHKKKLAFVFSAMRHFADELRAAGWRIDYVRLDDSGNSGTLAGEVRRAMKRHAMAGSLLMTEPGEWRLREALCRPSPDRGFDVEVLEDDRFVASHAEFWRWADGRKELRMEYFYRQMRRKTGLLMEGDKPAGGKWNFDAENRKPATADLFLPQPLQFAPDAITSEVLSLVGERFADHFGELEPFWFAVTRKQAEAARDHFIDRCLPRFGDYQDAMLTGQRFLYHSVLSHYINCGLLDALETCRMVEQAWREGKAPINAAEGFVRQIIGWREFVRGIYWREMPGYGGQNFFDAKRPLPDFYWTGETDMRCLAEAITQTREEAYAHHIQRLMITGNFAMLAGIDPDAVHRWYLGVYADAYEWVEMPNTLGMSQYADGGLLGSKPYAASGAYIDRMSDYCGSCRYDVRQKTGEGACPFNALYWDFLARNEHLLAGNARLRNPYSTWRRMSEEKRADYRASAKAFLDAL